MEWDENCYLEMKNSWWNLLPDIIRVVVATIVTIGAFFLLINFNYYLGEVYSLYFKANGCPFGGLEYTECLFSRLQDKPFVSVIIAVFGYILASGVVLLAAIFSKRSLKEMIGKSVDKSTFFWCLLWTAFFSGAWLLIDRVIDIDDLEHTPVTREDLKDIELLLDVLFFAPVFEELIVRGYFQTSMKDTFLGSWGSIVFSAMLFSWVHGYGVYGSIFVFSGGVFLGYLRCWTDSLSVPIMAHVLINLIVFLNQVLIMY